MLLLCIKPLHIFKGQRFIFTFHIQYVRNCFPGIEGFFGLDIGFHFNRLNPPKIDIECIDSLDFRRKRSFQGNRFI